jgi:hypothetical protein
MSHDTTRRATILTSQSKLTVADRVSWAIFGAERATTSLVEPIRINVISNDIIEVLDRSTEDVWVLERGLEPRKLGLILPQELTDNELRQALPLSSGARLVIAANGTMSLWILRTDGEGARVSLDTRIGQKFFPISAELLSDGRIVLGQPRASNVQISPEDSLPPGPGGLLILDESVRWLRRTAPGELEEPASISRTTRNSVLVADSTLHVVYEISLIDGEVVWQYGHCGLPGATAGRLRAPQDARETSAGVLIADMMNNRVIEVAWSGEIVWEYGADDFQHDRWNYGSLAAPESAAELPNGQLVIADTDGSRVIVMNRDKAVICFWGMNGAGRRLLSFPRSVYPTERATYLVADMNHNRVIEIDAAGTVLWEFGNGVPHRDAILKWPRCVRRTLDGRVVIAEALGDRIIWIAGDKIVKEMHLRSLCQWGVDVQDVHDLRLLPDGGIILLDAESGVLFELDAMGDLTWTFGLGPETRGALKDPHQVIPSSKGNLLVADAGNDRLVFISRSGGIESVIDSLRTPWGETLKLLRPRAVGHHNGNIVASDDFGSILLFSKDGLLHDQIAANVVLGSSRVRMGPARDIVTLSRTEILVCDYGRHRLLALRLADDQQRVHRQISDADLPDFRRA